MKMITVAILAASILFVLAAYQLVVSFLFFLQMRKRPKEIAVADRELPSASVLLALRGADPDLADGMRRLLQEDYPDLELRLVIDSESDPAWEVVSRVQEELNNPNLVFESLKTRPTTNSLHCASLVQLMDALPDEREVIVLVDGDVVGHRGFMKELIGPIARGEYDSAHGNRWYAPTVGRFGSMVRYVWNAAALMTMYWSGIPWGGMFAARAKAVKESGVVDDWGKAMAVDACVMECFKARGIKSKFVPSLIMVNGEDCGFLANYQFVSRQLLWTRLYQPRPFWWTIIFHAFVTNIAIFLTLILAVAGFASGAQIAAIWAIAGFFVYHIAMAGSLFFLEWGARKATSENQNKIEWLSMTKLIKLIFATPVTQVVHLAAICRVLLQKHLVWRGIKYRIDKPFDVRLLDDQPFKQPAVSGDSIQ